jgi:hypothetical protein
MIIRFLVRISAKAFQIAIFGRLLLNFVSKSKLSYLGLRSKITLESLPSCACYFCLMMKTWFYLLNPLTLDKRDVRGSRVGNYRVWIAEGSRGCLVYPSPNRRSVELARSMFATNILIVML